MAAASSLTSFLSFLLPGKPQPQPPSITRFPLQSHKLCAQHHDHHSPELSSHVMNPSHAHANTLFFRSAYNVQVVVDENEPEERLLNRFRREVMKAGVIQECKRRRFFENKQEEKKRKTREAAKRNSRRRRPQSRYQAQNKPDVATTKKVEDDDNWDLPEYDVDHWNVFKLLSDQGFLSDEVTEIHDLVGTRLRVRYRVFKHELKNLVMKKQCRRCQNMVVLLEK
ncbi:unnamed protein product [Sphenostylis stenocarpa]|uniref:Uncharacterized protein n=1 Tax=Sphenostylis stenocarpa TaxID=92480 RepID=A0AA86V0Z5_9FABA|nr:unnamed protein product [Sphenostylis stenocarpa]